MVGLLLQNGAQVPLHRKPMVRGSGFRVQGAGCRVQGAGFRVQGGEHAWGVREMYGPEAVGVLAAWIRLSGLNVYTSDFEVSGLGASRLRFRVRVSDP